jgi:hypothetical protein
MWFRGHLEWQHLPTKFYENPPISSKVISGGYTDRQAGDLISPLSFFESRLIKWEPEILFLSIQFIAFIYATVLMYIICVVWVQNLVSQNGKNTEGVWEKGAEDRRGMSERTSQWGAPKCILFFKYYEGDEIIMRSSTICILLQIFRGWSNHNEELHNLYSSSDIIRMIKS